MDQDDVVRAYFDWMYDKVCGERFPNGVSYRKLLTLLHDTEFVYSISRDANRAEDGINLRYRFSYETKYDNSYLYGPCSVLEMILGVAMRCEEIMDDPIIGDRIGQWLWDMIINLGLGSMDDTRFDRPYVNSVVKKFLKRDYEPNGQGGLFTIKRCKDDLRDVEIWYQMCWYLDSIVCI